MHPRIHIWVYMCRLTTIMIMIRTITGTNYKTQPLLAQYFLLLLLNESEIQRKAIAHDPANTKHTVLCSARPEIYIKYGRLRQYDGKNETTRDEPIKHTRFKSVCSKQQQQQNGKAAHRTRTRKNAYTTDRFSIHRKIKKTNV